MINWNLAWARLKRLPQFKQMSESDFRPLTYVQTFTPSNSGAVTGNQSQQFPGGAIILGISASAFIPSVAGDAQGSGGRNRNLFLINLTFSNNESLTPGGPVLADALMGGGDADQYPARELVLAPNQIINCQVAQVTTGQLTVHVCYHTMVYRFGS